MSIRMTGNVEHRLLYRYIGMAYDAVARMSKETVWGDAEAFLARLYRRRFSSVFGHPFDDGEDAKQGLKDVADLFEYAHREHNDDIIPFRFDNIRATVEQAGVTETSGDRPHIEDDRFRDYGELGIEAFATYLPIHFFPEGHWRNEKPGWGIYVSEAGVRHVARKIEEEFISRYGSPSPDDSASFLRIAFEVLLRHEMEHFKVESFALNAEMQQRKPLYVPYLMTVYAHTYNSDHCLEEALANATVLDSTVIKKLVYALYPQKPRDWPQVLAKALFDQQPPGYSNYRLERIWHHETATDRLRLINLTERLRRDAMNYLCNQVATGTLIPGGEILPFYAFPPDNYFLRAESLVPIYVVTDLSDEMSFIRFTVPTRQDWEWLLRQIGFTPTKRGNGDHIVWARPGFEMITNNYFGKELDPRSYKSALRTIQTSGKEVLQALRNRAALNRLRDRLDELALQLR